MITEVIQDAFDAIDAYGHVPPTPEQLELWSLSIYTRMEAEPRRMLDLVLARAVNTLTRMEKKIVAPYGLPGEV